MKVYILLESGDCCETYIHGVCHEETAAQDWADRLNSENKCKDFSYKEFKVIYGQIPSELSEREIRDYGV